MKQKKTIKINEQIENAVRYNKAISEGLSSEEVLLRENEGLINKTKKRVSKSYFKIFFDNFVNFFNIILYILAALLIIVGEYFSLVFLVILILNITINLIQDIRARRMTDKLRLTTRPDIRVIRDSSEKVIKSNELVLDDIFIISAGDLIYCDGIIVSGNCSVDESSLSGESISVRKKVGDQVLSGTYVRNGYVKVRADRIGAANYVEQMQEKSREFKRPKTEIFKSINNILKVIAVIVLVIMTMTIIIEAIDGYFKTLELFRETIGRLAGSIVPMIPSGMYLLTSITLTYGVLRLHKHNTLVQELYSIETLARTDTLCLDKTGTLTDGKVVVENVDIYAKVSEFDVKRAILSLLNATKDQNASALALLSYYDLNRNFKNYLKVESHLAFDSVNKYSMAKFTNGETYLLGAPEMLFEKDSKALELAIKKAQAGHRVMALVRLKSQRSKLVPSNFQVVALFELRDQIRSDAKDTLKWFYENDVNSIIISGDNLEYIQSIAQRVEFVGYERGISLEGMSLEEVQKVALNFQIFARATPEQKEVIIKTLQANKHVVTMIGDGVNDILALKSANCSVAMASGSDAAKNISHLVLTKSSFSSLPEVVKEGRRVINNLQRTCSLFLVKTFFSIFMSLAFLIARPISMAYPNFTTITYPLEVNSFYLWEIFCIGLAAVFLAFEPNYQRIKGTFTKNVIMQALPSALVMIFAVGSIFLLQSYETSHPNTLMITSENSVTMAGITMSVLGVFILLRICLPFSKWRLSVFAVIAGVVAGLLFSLGFIQYTNASGELVNVGEGLLRINFYTLNWINFFEILSLIGAGALLLVGLNYLFEYYDKQKKKGVNHAHQ